MLSNIVVVACVHACAIIAVSVEELRQATCYDDDSQLDDASSQLDSDSELSLPPRKVGLYHISCGSQWCSGNMPDHSVCGSRIDFRLGQPV